MTTFETAITTAQGALTATTQAAVDAAVTVLDTAITTFKDARKAGNRDEGYTAAQLTALIAEAKALKEDVATNTDAANVEEGTSWVTAEEMSAFESAITAAENATESTINDAYVALSTAITTFSGKLKVGTKPIVSFAALEALIGTANDTKTGVVTNTDAANVAQGIHWVTAEVMIAFESAITAAESALTATTQTEVNDAVAALTDAITTFTTARGTGTKTTGFTATQLAALIAQAKAEKALVVEDTHADNVPGGAHWVTPGEMTALDTAIIAAESASGDAAIDSNYVALGTALTTFIDARKTGTTVSTASLATLIASAKTERTGVVVNTAAANVDEGVKWVTQAVMTAFDSAIATAEGALSATTQAAVNTAVTNLNNAITTFTTARGTGTKITYDELTGLIAAAKAAKTGVEVNTAAANVDQGVKWVTQAVMTAFDGAITTAEGALSASTQAAVNTAVTNLTAAITTFTNAQSTGTKVAGPATVDYGTTLSWGSVYTPNTLGLVPGKTTTELNLNWLTGVTSTSDKSAQVRFIEGTKNAGYNLIQATGSVATASSSSSIYHYVTVTGLVPGKSYQYSVSDNGTNWSQMYDYKVPAATGAWKFAVISDPQLNTTGSNSANVDTNSRYPATTVTTANGWLETMRKVAAADVSFIVSCGDQIDSVSTSGTTVRDEYTRFFAPPELRSLPLAPVLGNHDTATHVRYYYNLPNDPSNRSSAADMGNYYYLYNNILFVGLNTSAGTYNANTNNFSSQITLFNNTITAAKTAHAGKYDWLIVQHHKSTASVADHLADMDIQRYVEDGFERIMSEQHVDFVLAGHDHVYARSWPLAGRDGGKVSVPDKTAPGPNNTFTNPGNPIYLTFTTSSGIKYYAVSSDTTFNYNNTLYVKNNNVYPYLGESTATEGSTYFGSSAYMTEKRLPVSNAAYVQPYIPSYTVVEVNNNPTVGSRSITFKTYPIATRNGQGTHAGATPWSFNENTPYDTVTVVK
jgi:hypothetical protein